MASRVCSAVPPPRARSARRPRQAGTQEPESRRPSSSLGTHPRGPAEEARGVWLCDWFPPLGTKVSRSSVACQVSPFHAENIPRWDTHEWVSMLRGQNHSVRMCREVAAPPGLGHLARLGSFRATLWEKVQAHGSSNARPGHLSLGNGRHGPLDGDTHRNAFSNDKNVGACSGSSR